MIDNLGNAPFVERVLRVNVHVEKLEGTAEDELISVING